MYHSNLKEHKEVSWQKAIVCIDGVQIGTTMLNFKITPIVEDIDHELIKPLMIQNYQKDCHPVTGEQLDKE